MLTVPASSSGATLGTTADWSCGQFSHFYLTCSTEMWESQDLPLFTCPAASGQQDSPVLAVWSGIALTSREPTHYGVGLSSNYYTGALCVWNEASNQWLAFTVSEGTYLCYCDHVNWRNLHTGK